MWTLHKVGGPERPADHLGFAPDSFYSILLSIRVSATALGHFNIKVFPWLSINQLNPARHSAKPSREPGRRRSQDGFIGPKAVYHTAAKLA
jgi:hypothetical protein